MKLCLWLDDLRDPTTTEWIDSIPHGYSVVWVKTWTEFVDWITINGLPNCISFDHDLGETIDRKDGKDCANWLVDWCLDRYLELPKWQVHSMNSVGRINITSLLQGYDKHYARTIKN